MSVSCLGQWGLAVRGDGHKKAAVSSPCLPLCLARLPAACRGSHCIPASPCRAECSRMDRGLCLWGCEPAAELCP